MTTSTPSASDQVQKPDLRQSLREELEETRSLFMELTASTGESNWNNQSGNPAWTVGQVLGHILLIFNAIPWKLSRIRKGKGAPGLPKILFDPLNAWSTRLGTRKYRPDNIVAAYDEAHRAALEALESVSDDEWTLAARFFGVYQDVPELFHYHASHTREHEPDIRAGLGQTR